jgi:ribosomal subunit interface protein
MIERLEIANLHTPTDKDIEKYARKKVGGLDRFVSRGIRDSLHVEVKLKDSNTKDKKHSLCEVILRLPHETITSSESALNMYAAIDIVETKLKYQLRKYKDLHTNPKFHRRVFARFHKD